MTVLQPPPLTSIKAALCLAAALSSGACGSEPPPVARPGVVTWEPVEAWSGRASMQTDTFTIEAPEWRVRWETRGEPSPGAGVFRVTVNSADSGNPVMVAVDRRGMGRDTSYVRDERPRRYYLTIDAADLEWSVTVERPVGGQ